MPARRQRPLAVVLSLPHRDVPTARYAMRDRVQMTCHPGLPAALCSVPLWQTRFGGDRGVFVDAESGRDVIRGDRRDAGARLPVNPSSRSARALPDRQRGTGSCPRRLVTTSLLERAPTRCGRWPGPLPHYPESNGDGRERTSPRMDHRALDAHRVQVLLAPSGIAASVVRERRQPVLARATYAPRDDRPAALVWAWPYRPSTTAESSCCPRSSRR